MSESLALDRARGSTQGGQRGARKVIIGAMIASLLVTAVTGNWARAKRDAATRGTSPINANRTTVASLNSYTLALLLGGLRGPLVMMLWTSSESQKQQKDLEDFDTKVELIRLLQPEFDTVLIFEIWNKAYNISVQMSSLFNKYTTILDAIDYGQSALQAKPDDINILSAVADVYFNKLGNASEKDFYRVHVRRETLPHVSHQAADRSAPGWRRVELDQILDAKGMLLPKLLRPTRSRPADLAADQPFNDGSTFQYLAPFQPFTYGASPFAIAYNYYKQAQTLQRVAHVRHAQLSPMVVDSRPAVSLTFWAKEEQELGRRNELVALGRDMSGADDMALEVPAASVPLDAKIANSAKFAETIFNYDRCAAVAADGLTEYEYFLKMFPNNALSDASHLDELRALTHQALADAAYLRAMQTVGAARTAAIATATSEYHQAITAFQRILLRYYTDDRILQRVAPKTSRDQIETMTPPAIDQLNRGVEAAIAHGENDTHTEDRGEYDLDIVRCVTRLQMLGQ